LLQHQKNRGVFDGTGQRLHRVLDAVKKTTQLEQRTDLYAAVYGRLESEIPRKLELREWPDNHLQLVRPPW
jgi:hypothetical protein